jgi:hypothetical protein
MKVFEEIFKVAEEQFMKVNKPVEKGDSLEIEIPNVEDEAGLRLVFLENGFDYIEGMMVKL